MVVLLCGKEERMAGPGLPCQRSPWLVRFHIVLLVPAARKVRVCLCPAPYHILMSHHSTAVQKNHTGTYVLTVISACRRGTCARVTDTGHEVASLSTGWDGAAVHWAWCGLSFCPRPR